MYFIARQWKLSKETKYFKNLKNGDKETTASSNSNWTLSSFLSWKQKCMQNIVYTPNTISVLLNKFSAWGYAIQTAWWKQGFQTCSTLQWKTALKLRSWEDICVHHSEWTCSDWAAEPQNHRIQDAHLSVCIMHLTQAAFSALHQRCIPFQNTSALDYTNAHTLPSHELIPFPAVP